jgi:hypothetical protein
MIFSLNKGCIALQNLTYIGTTKFNKDLDRRGIFKKKINEKKKFSAFSNIITFNMHIKCFRVHFLHNNHPSAYY